MAGSVTNLNRLINMLEFHQSVNSLLMALEKFVAKVLSIVYHELSTRKPEGLPDVQLIQI